MTVQGNERDGGPSARAGTLIGRETGRRDEIAALGQLLVILGILIVIAAILGTVSIGWA